MRHYVDYMKSPRTTACGEPASKDVYANFPGISISNNWMDVDCKACIETHTVAGTYPEAEAEVLYWKEQFELAVKALEKAKPHGAYGFKAGRKPSPRESKQMRAAFEAHRRAKGAEGKTPEQAFEAGIAFAADMILRRALDLKNRMRAQGRELTPENMEYIRGYERAAKWAWINKGKRP